MSHIMQRGAHSDDKVIRRKGTLRKLGHSGVLVMLFLGRRMDGFSAPDFECAAATPVGQEADCQFRSLKEVEEAE